MDLDTAFAFVRNWDCGVLLTIGADGRPHASNINFAATLPTVRISVTADRVKTANLRRDPRASLHVTSSDFWTWVVLEGTASLSPIASEGDRETAEALRQLYRDIRGEHNNWADYDRAMVQDQRQVLTIEVTRAYGQLPRD